MLTRNRLPQALGALVLGPVSTPEGLVRLRTPRLDDAEAWSAARLANREWLERAFPAWGDDWDAEQQPADWIRRWWHLRSLFLRGKAKSFVIELNGSLIGELGIDAIDPVSSGGEASVWMVRDHGSGGVMNAISLLLIEYAFTGPRPLQQITSPVATSSRKGRAPGLSAVGFTIEATVQRHVGDKGMVDHDIWVLHNTAAVRGGLAKMLAGMSPEGRVSPGARPAHGSRRVLAAAAAHTAVRGARAGLRAARAPSGAWEHPPAMGGDVALRPPRAREAGAAGLSTHISERAQARRGTLIPWTITKADKAVGAVRVRNDAGTGTTEIVAWVEAGVDRGVLSSALRLALSAVREPGRGSNAVAVRVPTGSPGRVVPDETMLTDAGLVLVASFAGHPDGVGWAGEQRWELPAVT